jgi:hypothetical protein
LADLVVEICDLRPCDGLDLGLIPAWKDVSFNAAAIVARTALSDGMPLEIGGAKISHCCALGVGLASRKRISSIDDHCEVLTRTVSRLVQGQGAIPTNYHKSLPSLEAIAEYE